MKEIYMDAEDTKPYNMPLPLGIIVYCNLSPVPWYSKLQSTVEASTFVSELSRYG